MSKTISAGRNPKIFIESINGDLSLVGWEGEDVLLKGDDDEMRVKQNGEEINFSCNDDLSVRVPKGASVAIKHIAGDASIRGILGGIELVQVDGDLSIRDVNSVAINTVSSDFSLRGAKGHVAVKNANSDVSIRDVDGNVSLDAIADDLALRDVRGNVSANVSEDVVFYVNPQPGRAYAISAGSDILLVMPPKANATITLSADEIDVDWVGSDIQHNDSNQVITVGDGSASVSLSAGGDIRISNRAEAGDSAEEFGNFAGMGMDWSDFGERISRQVEQATRRATQKADAALRRAEQNVERSVRRGAFLKVGRWNWDVAPKGVPMPPPAPKATEEERLAILKMLQDKVITADDADKLLAALEGES